MRQRGGAPSKIKAYRSTSLATTFLSSSFQWCSDEYPRACLPRNSWLSNVTPNFAHRPAVMILHRSYQILDKIKQINQTHFPVMTPMEPVMVPGETSTQSAYCEM